MASRALKRIVPIDADSLGILRAAICGFVLLQVLLINFADFGRLPITVMRPTGAMQLLSWRFYDALITPRGMLILKLVFVLALMGAVAGYFTSLATKCVAVLFMFYEGLVRSFGVFNHDEMVVAYILVVLAFTPCGDGFSLDKYFGRVRPRTPGFAYGYPILLLRIMVAWSYFSSALIKLRVTGVRYFSPDNLPTAAIWHSLDNFHESQFRFAFWLPNVRGFVTTALVGVVVMWELAFPLAIFSSRARRVILPFGIAFHVLTVLLMNLWFPYHVVSYVVFVDWPRVWTRLAASRVFRALSSSLRSRRVKQLVAGG